MAVDFATRIINRALLIQIGTRVLLVIKDRTLRGEFLPGSTGNSQYSTTPMPMPFDALTKKVRGSRTVKDLVRSGDARVFMNIKSRRAWIVLLGGYKQLRELAGRETDRVTLNWSGRMMRNLKIINVNTGAGTVTIGFSDADSERIASYHQTLGAGKAKKTHKFMGLTEQEKSGLGEWVESVMRFS